MSCLFFFNDTATTEIYTLSLHDALPIWRTMPPGRYQPLRRWRGARRGGEPVRGHAPGRARGHAWSPGRSEEHTSELQSRQYLVCRLLLEKKKNITRIIIRAKHIKRHDET